MMMRNIHKRVLQCLLLLLFLSSALQAQEIRTLDSILAKVRKDNPVLQAYDYQAGAMRAYAEGAGSWMPPMVGAGTFMTPYPGQELQSHEDKGMLMLAAEQSIPGPGKLRARKNFLESKTAVEIASKGAAFNQLRAEAKSLYYQWIVLEKKKTVLEESLEIMQTLLKLAEIRYPYNQGSLGSIYKAKGRLHEVENSLLENGRERIEKNILLNTLMDIPRETRYGIDTAMRDPGRILPEADSVYLLRNRSDLLRIRNRIESMQLEVKLEKLERRPDFSIRLEHMRPYQGMMSDRYTVMGMLSIPIAPWSSKSYKSRIKGIELEIKAMETGRQAKLREMQGILDGLTEDIRIVRQQLQNYEGKILPALRRNYETTLLAYEQNSEELPMVIDAWEAMNMASMERLDKLREYYLLVVRYEKELDQQ